MLGSESRIRLRNFSRLALRRCFSSAEAIAEAVLLGNSVRCTDKHYIHDK